jgi:hypothetical protein
MIQERCACGSSFKTDEVTAHKLVREWRRVHACPTETAPEFRDIETASTIGFSADYKGTGLDIPAKEYDPWGDDE